MDKRRFERFPLKNFITCNYNRYSSGTACLTENISLKGARFISENKLQANKKIKLRLYFVPKIGRKEVVCRVVYSDQQEDKFGKYYIYGVEFSKRIFKEIEELLDNEH